jgi:hypothetical protein
MPAVLVAHRVMAAVLLVDETPGAQNLPVAEVVAADRRGAAVLFPAEEAGGQAGNRDAVERRRGLGPLKEEIRNVGKHGCILAFHRQRVKEISSIPYVSVIEF